MSKNLKAVPKSNKSKTIELPQTKETKGTIVYSIEENGRPVTFYIPKTWLGKDKPTTIQFTISWE